MPNRVTRYWRRLSRRSGDAAIGGSKQATPLAAAATNQVQKEHPQHAKRYWNPRRRRLGCWIVIGGLPLGWYIGNGMLLHWLSNPIAASVAFVMTAGFTAMVWWSTDRMQQVSARTLRHLRKQFAAEHRPWIAVDVSLVSGLKWNETVGRVTLRFMLTNTGDVPALAAMPTFDWFLLPGPKWESPVDAQRAIAQRTRRPRTADATQGVHIFPKQDIPLDFILEIPRSAFTDTEQWMKEQLGADGVTSGYLNVVGTVNYGSTFPRRGHQTGFILELSRIAPFTAGPKLAIGPDAGDIAQENLRLYHSIYGAGVIY